jgi:hypothetical protein
MEAILFSHLQDLPHGIRSQNSAVTTLLSFKSRKLKAISLQCFRFPEGHFILGFRDFAGLFPDVKVT